MSDTVERLRRWELEGVAGTSAERQLVVNEASDEIEDDGVWVLLKGGGVENVSGPRSGSNGELDGEGEGEWTFMGNVKARGVGEMTFSMGVLGSGSATATSRADGGGGGGGLMRREEEEQWDQLTVYERVARADGGHDGDNWNARRKRGQLMGREN
jgi:hypothetical protein